MKNVLISVRPEWCEKILSGKKTIEVRKSAPKEVPFRAYIYCTKTKNKWALSGYEGAYQNSKGEVIDAQGKVIGEFICDKVDEYVLILDYNGDNYATSKGWRAFPFKEACLSQEEIVDYGKGKTLYGWHISDLKIYDKPRELSEFISASERCKVGYSKCNKIVCGLYPCSCMTITRAPQSWCYVEEAKE